MGSTGANGAFRVTRENVLGSMWEELGGDEEGDNESVQRQCGGEE